MALPTNHSRRSNPRVRRIASWSVALVLTGSGLPIGAPVGIAAAQGADGAWSSPFDHPASRRLHCAVYDPLHARMIVFGGLSVGGGGEPLDQVWTLSLGDRPEWSSHLVSGPVPARRYGASAIFDPARDRVIMFGGSIAFLGPEPESDEIWALSLTGTPTWTLLSAAGEPPSGRAFHTAVYDSRRDRMIVFGGMVIEGSEHIKLGDTWALDLSAAPTWSEIAPPMPWFLPRKEHAAAYDPVHDRMIVFGGEGVGYGYRNDTWELSLVGTPAWRQLSPGLPPPPGLTPRSGHCILYDALGDRAILLGGWGAANGYSYSTLSDLWVLPAGADQWTRVPSHPWLESYRAPAILDERHRRIVAYNGRDAMGVQSVSLDSPYYDYSLLLPKPWPRSGQSAVYDPSRERMLMLLGATQDGWIDQTWELSLHGVARWSLLPTGGAYEREYQTAIHDPIRDRLIVFGGWGSNETWELPLASPAWNRLSPGGTVPEFREGHSAIHDARRDRMIVFGGVGHTGSREDAFSLSLAGTMVWAPLPPGPPRAWHTAIHDPVGDRMLVLGGVVNSWYAVTNEVWALSLAEPMAWSLLSPAGDPPAARHQSSAIYDPIRHRVVVYGGCCFENEDDYTTAFGDTWELALDGPLQWRRMTSPGAPQGRRSANLIYDPPRDRAILSGGLDGDEGFPRHDDVWALTWGNPVLPSVSGPGDVVPGTPLVLDYVVSNPLPGRRAIEWTLTSERDWPGFPHRGLQIVEGGRSGAVRLELTLPDASFDAPNTLTFTGGFSGAPGHVAAVRHVVRSRTAAMGFELTPGTLNVAAKGRWVTGVLEPSAPITAGDIDVPSVRLNGSVPVAPSAPTALGDHNGNGVPDLMLKFERLAVELSVPEGDEVAVTVTGTARGLAFLGTDHIRVRRAALLAPAPGTHLTAGTMSRVTWEPPRGVPVQSMRLLASVDGGAIWSPIASNLQNTGNHDWSVPHVRTDQAKLAVVVVKSAEHSGEVEEGLLALSEGIRIESALDAGDRPPARIELAMRVPGPSPAAGGRLRVEFTLRDASPARLEVLDVAGRRLLTRHLGSLGPGSHVLELSEGGTLGSGIYFLRLLQAGDEVRARAVVFR